MVTYWLKSKVHPQASMTFCSVDMTQVPTCIVNILDVFDHFLIVHLLNKPHDLRYYLNSAGQVMR